MQPHQDGRPDDVTLREEPMQIVDHFRELVDSFSDLIAKHVTLTRLELKEDAKKIGIEVAKIVAFLPLLLVGYALLSIAIALFLHRFLAADAAFGLVAGLNLVVGAIGTSIAVRRLRAHELMNDTAQELDTTVTALTAGAQAGSET